MTKAPKTPPAQPPSRSFTVASALKHPQTVSPTSADDNTLLSPNNDSLALPSPYTQHVDPSPTDSTGTDSTEIDDEAQDGASIGAVGSTTASSSTVELELGNAASPSSPSTLAKLDTAVPIARELGDDDGPSSVIHAPHGFKNLTGHVSAGGGLYDNKRLSAHHAASPATPDAAKGPDDEQLLAQPLIQTHSQQEQEGTQPTELTRQDSVAESDSSSKFSASRPVLGSVDSSIPRHADDSNVQIVNVEGGLMPEEFSQPHEEISGEALKLRSALSECWTLCNTLESLSSTSRHRIFSQTARGTLQELAWNNCWKLCKDLYEYRDEPLLNMHQTIELCRDFARARFDARSRAHGAEDAMLRVSFEMNSHLYNIRDTTLPPTFTKRTMDFYVAFCHRMMKQRTVFPQETDALLRAGWWLAEALYMLQQSSIDGSNNDEELIAAAIQACWELSDLFRDGWSQRTERSTPRANQTRFPTRTRAALTTSEGRTSSLSNRTYHDATSSFPSQEPPLPPETPVTIFDDIVGSESPEANNVPNILVLGPDNSVSRPLRGQDSHHDRWSSNASSTASGHSGRVQPSQRTSSSIRNSEERYHLHMLRAMLLKAAVKHGFDPRASTSLTDGALQDFVVSLPDDVFGNGVHEVQLFQHYRSLITKDRPLRNVGRLLGKTFPAGHVAQAVRWLIDRSRSEWSWMSPLYEYVMGSRLTDMGEDRLASSLEF